MFLLFFLFNFRGQTSFGGDKSRFREHPLPPCSRKPALERKKQLDLVLKKLKRRQHSQSYYKKNQETIKQQKKEARSVQKSNTAETIKKRKYRAKKPKKAKVRERNRQNQFKSRQQKLAFRRSNIDDLEETPTLTRQTSNFTSKYQKFRLKKKLYSTIPVSNTRSRKADLIESLA